AKQPFGLAVVGTTFGPVVSAEKTQNESHPLAFSKCEVGNHAIAVGSQRQLSGQAQAQCRSVEAGAVSTDVQPVAGTGVIEGGAAFQVKGQFAANDAHSADQFIGHRTCTTDGHVILDLPHAVIVQKPRDQNGSVRPVELLVSQVFMGRGDA